MKRYAGRIQLSRVCFRTRGWCAWESDFPVGLFDGHSVHGALPKQAPSFKRQERWLECAFCHWLLLLSSRVRPRMSAQHGHKRIFLSCCSPRTFLLVDIFAQASWDYISDSFSTALIHLLQFSSSLSIHLEQHT